MHGWPIFEPKLRHVQPQIDKVYGLHKLNKIYVFSDLLEYLREKQTFSYELDDENKPTDKLKDEQQFHLMAAERYILSVSPFQAITAFCPGS